MKANQQRHLIVNVDSLLNYVTLIGMLSNFFFLFLLNSF